MITRPESFADLESVYGETKRAVQELIEVMKPRELSRSQCSELHAAITQALAGKPPYVAIRAEMAAVLFFLQPDTLFHKCYYTPTVQYYLYSVMQVPRNSMYNYKRDLLRKVRVDPQLRHSAESALRCAQRFLKLHNIL